MPSFYNEIDPYAAAWLRNLIKAGLIPDGEVSTRSIVDLRPSDLSGFDQCHFFAGIGGWSQALRLAGWPAHRPVWTASCPCQPFSEAGKGLGEADPRHLWPEARRLISACRPPVVLGEQVARKAGYGWFDGVRADLAAEGYASGAFDLAALAVNAPHIRQRLYWGAVNVADTDEGGRGRWAWDGAGERDGQAPERDEGHRQLAGCREDHHDVADADLDRQHSGFAGDARGQEGSGRPHGHEPDRRGSSGDMADAEGLGPQERERQDRQPDARGRSQGRLDPLRNRSFWSDAIWVEGSDRKARRLIAACRPSVVLGEQVARKAG